MAVNFLKMRKLINRIPVAKFRVEKAKSAACKMTATLSSEPRSTVPRDRVADGAILIDAAREAYAALSGELGLMQEELRPYIDNLDDPLMRMCMQMRYMDGISAREIAYKLNYSERRIYQMLKAAEGEVLLHG